MGIYPDLGLYPATCWVGGRQGTGGNVFRRMDVINDFNSIPCRRLVSRKSQAPQVGRVDRRGTPGSGPAARRSTPRLGLASDTLVEDSSPRDDGLWLPCETRYERQSFHQSFRWIQYGPQEADFRLPLFAFAAVTQSSVVVFNCVSSHKGQTAHPTPLTRGGAQIS